ncbi:unnamed protein product, partial [Ilex paraguariensis]
MSVRFSFNDPIFRRLMVKIEEGFQLFGGIVFLNYFPFLRYFPHFRKEITKIDENKKQTHDFFQKIIDEHRRTFSETKTRDVLDCYLMEIRRAELSGTSENLFQEVAKSVQAELDAVVGRKRLPTFDDLPYLPITEATILEVLRKSSVVPLGNSHATMV